MTKEEIKQEIRDALGLPFYDSMSRELTSINNHIESVLDDIIDVVKKGC